jgi:predicted O-methyltransferase YrrM
MKQNRMPAFLSLILVLSLASSALCAAEAARSRDAFRQEFLKNFKRIGLNTATGDAMMLQILVESTRAKRGIEVGTATGYGAMHMGIAFERTGGHLDTVDIDPAMVKTARANLEAIGLEKTVTAIEGDALKVLPELQGEYDFVFLDAVKQDYLKYLKALLPRLKPGAMIVADNVIQSARQMKDFLDFVQNSPDYDTTIIRSSIEKNDGMAVIYKLR